MAFRVGQKVVCIKRDQWMWSEKNGTPYSGAAPVYGGVYTVRGYDTHPYRGLLLEEFRISDALYHDGSEIGWTASRFRPVVERETDISALQALLVPGAKIREHA